MGLSVLILFLPVPGKLNAARHLMNCSAFIINHILNEAACLCVTSGERSSCLNGLRPKQELQEPHPHFSML